MAFTASESFVSSYNGAATLGEDFVLDSFLIKLNVFVDAST